MLVDVTRDFAVQSAAIDGIDAVLLTHAHRDAAGGIGALRRWWGDRGVGPIPVYSHPRFPTFAWRLDMDAEAALYASDVARLTPKLE